MVQKKSGKSISRYISRDVLLLIVSVITMIIMITLIKRTVPDRFVVVSVGLIESCQAGEHQV